MEMQNQKGKHGGSTFGRIYKCRARVSTAYQLEQDYFVENSTYLDADFRSCYRMSKKLFLRILADVEKRDQYFVQKNDAIGRPGLTSKIKFCFDYKSTLNIGVVGTWPKRMAWMVI
ncbi:hypothetical protein IFM89_022766 [Coptis chinensis]|uniref:Uncharacterized protein n=1 Tax=Coptis chinensis TaxID=261450 RepID=A0A835IQJ4_9MAGN|nr:hypothetical protein IFM89_022766 [Coptis chinensis]